MPQADQNESLTLEDAGFATLLLVAAVLPGIFLFAHFSGAGIATGITGTLLMEAGLLAAVAWVMRHRRLSWTDTFGLQKNRLPRAALFGVAGCVALLPVLLLLSGLWRLMLKSLGLPVDNQPAIEWITSNQSRILLGLLFLQAAVAAPVIEELFFRGLLEQSFRSRVQPRIAAVLSALLFAAFHAHLPSLLPLFAIALGFSAVYYYTRSLAAAVVMHALYNTINFMWVLIAPPT
jgi:membrane protease YdiL (CAAX protease family)